MRKILLPIFYLPTNLIILLILSCSVLCNELWSLFWYFKRFNPNDKWKVSCKDLKEMIKNCNILTDTYINH